MRIKFIDSALTCLVACTLLAIPAGSLAGTVLIFKGSTLDQNNLDGLITLHNGGVVTSMEIQVASWGIPHGSEDFLVYDPYTRTCEIYDYALILNLPPLDETVTLPEGKTGAIRDLLEDEPFIVYDTDMGMTGALPLAAAIVAQPPPPPPPPSDTTPPNTTIISGPSGTITVKDVTFIYTGSDNKTSVANLVYAHKLDGYEADWSPYSSSTSTSYTDLPNGPYTFLVRAKDQAQKVDPTPASRSFTVGGGDVNDDGGLGLDDAILSLRICAGIVPTSTVYLGADMNGDGKICIEEAIFILQTISNLR